MLVQVRMSRRVSVGRPASKTLGVVAQLVGEAWWFDSLVVYKDQLGVRDARLWLACCLLGLE